METKLQFPFCTIRCAECGEPVDSKSLDDERLLEEDDMEFRLTENLGWQRLYIGDGNSAYLCPKCIKDGYKIKDYSKNCVEVKDITLYGVRCDLCGEQWEDSGSGGTSYEDKGQAADMARDEDGWATINGKDYCSDCWHNCQELQEGLEGDCETCKCYHWCQGEGEIPNPRPFVSNKCPLDCPYFERTAPYKAKCNLPIEEAAKCKRIIWWKKEQARLSQKGEVK